ncbi:MAG: tetratricopeptide repeat protein [Candidatus Thorarchaeota archaeon]
MEPLGTITKYYPFIDDESKTILDSLMDKSSSYYNFVQQLCKVVLNNDVPLELAYLATVQAWWCRIKGVMKSIKEKYGDKLRIKPWLHIIDSGERDQVLSHDSVVASIAKLIENSVDDWIEVELHILHAFLHHPFGEVISLFEPLEKVKGLIEANPQLGCFESVIHAFEGIAFVREGNISKALEVLQKGKSLAEKHDDALYLYMNMLQEGIILTYVDIHDAAAVFENLYELVQDLEIPAFVTEILNDSSLVYETTGEFDLTISSHNEIMNITGSGRLSDTTFIILARTYATIGEGQYALEWISRGIEDSGQFESAQMLLYKAWALALVNRIDEATQTIETAYSLLIKAGLERNLGDYYHIMGVIELKKGDFLTALDFLERAWDIANKNPRGNNQNRAILDLVRAENMMAAQSKDSMKVAAPGKWLSTLEKYANDRDLQGIKMYAALLKSEFYQNHGQLKDALATLKDALTITDSLGVQTLRRKITKRIQVIEQLLRQEGTIS